PGWDWRPEQRGPISRRASAVTCSSRANWSRPTSAPDWLFARDGDGAEPARAGGAQASSGPLGKGADVSGRHDLAVGENWPLGILSGFLETRMVTGWRSGNSRAGGWLMRRQA